MDPVMLQTAEMIYVDPLTFMLILLGIGVVFGLLIWFIEVRHRASVESSLVSAEVTSLNTQTSMMAILTQSIVTSLNTNTATYQQVAQAETNNYTKLVDSMVNYLNILSATYQMQAQHTMNFEDRLLNLISMQMGIQDIRQLMSDKIKASTIEAVKNPTIQLETQTSSSK